MTVTYLAGKQLKGLSTDNLPNNLQEGSMMLETDTAKLDFIKGGWKELARTTLGSAGDAIDVSVADKRYYMCLSSIIPTGACSDALRFNSDTATNYSSRWSQDGGADSSEVSASVIYKTTRSNTTPFFSVGYQANYSTKEKLHQCWKIGQSTAGAGNAPDREEITGKWANTANAISSFNSLNQGAGSYDVGSEVVVLGYDPADTHTTNFWEELASVNSLTGGNVDSGTFTAKKYLWVQFELIVNAYDSTNVVIQFNADTAGNYANRISQNGGADSTTVSQTSIATTISGGKRIFGNMFIINNSANEKLVIGHTVVIGTTANSTAEGAGVAPRRLEFVGKWDNTSNQITKIVFDDTIANFVSGQVKVWGSN